MVEAEVRYSGEHLKALFLLKNSKKIPANVVLNGLGMAFGIYLAYIGVEWLGYISSHNYGLLMIAFAVVLILMQIKRIVSTLTAAGKFTQLQPVGELRRFVFAEDDLTLLINSEYESSQRRFTYEGIDHAVETQKFFFIFFEKNQAGIIAKTDLVSGVPADLNVFLQRKLGGRFSVKKGGGL